MVVDAVMAHLRGRIVGAAFDATGMGWTVAEDMGRKYGLREDPQGAGVVMALKFTEEWYRLEMPPLKAAFEDNTLALIRDTDHVSDLRMVKVIRGIPRVPPIREGETGKKRHGDYAIALALAYWASRMRWTEYSYVATGAAAASPDGPTDSDDYDDREPYDSLTHALRRIF